MLLRRKYPQVKCLHHYSKLSWMESAKDSAKGAAKNLAGTATQLTIAAKDKIVDIPSIINNPITEAVYKRSIRLLWLCEILLYTLIFGTIMQNIIIPIATLYKMLQSSTRE